MTKYLVLFLLTSAQCLSWGQDVDFVPTQKNLDKISMAVDAMATGTFEEREAAEDSLLELPKEYFFVLLDAREKEVMNEARPEVIYRLTNAAVRLFYAKVLPTIRSYTDLWGDVGYSARDQYESYEYYEDGDGGGSYGPYPYGDTIGHTVMFVDPFGPADGKLRKWDVIIEVNGVDPSEFFSDIYYYDESEKPGEVSPDEELRFKVRRPTEESLKAIEERGVVQPKEDELEDVEVVITTGTKRPCDVDMKYERFVRKRLLSVYVDYFKSSRRERMTSKVIRLFRSGKISEYLESNRL